MNSGLEKRTFLLLLLFLKARISSSAETSEGEEHSVFLLRKLPELTIADWLFLEIESWLELRSSEKSSSWAMEE